MVGSAWERAKRRHAHIFACQSPRSESGTGKVNLQYWSLVLTVVQCLLLPVICLLSLCTSLRIGGAAQNKFKSSRVVIHAGSFFSSCSSSLGRTDQRPVGRTRTEEIKPTLIKRLKLFSYFSSYKPFQLKVLIYSSINFPQPAELA